MRKTSKVLLLLVALIAVLFAFGCGANQMYQVGSQKGIVLVLKNNPKDIEPVVKGLTVIYDYTQCGSCGVADLKDIISKALPKNYQEVGDLVLSGIDDPVLTSYIDSLVNHNVSPETLQKVGQYVFELREQIKKIQT